MSDQTPVFGIEDGVGQSGGTWYADALSTAVDELSTGPGSAVGDDNLSYKWINTSTVSPIKNRIVRNVSNVTKSTIAAILGHNLSEGAMARLVIGKAVERPAFRCTGTAGDKAETAFSIAAPTGDYTIMLRAYARDCPGTSGSPVVYYFYDGVVAAANIMVQILDNPSGVVWARVFNYTSSTTLAVPAASVPRNRWSDWSIRYTHSGPTASVWIDGAQAVAETTVPSAVAHASNQISYGAAGQVGRWAFAAGEVWSRRFTDAEVIAWKAERRSGKENGLIAAHGFREGAGSTIADDGPSGYTLTKTGGSWISAVDDRRVTQDGYDSGEVQAYHNPPRVTAVELPSTATIKSPATITVPRSITMDAVIHPDQRIVNTTLAVIASFYKTAPISSDEQVLLYMGTGGSLLARTRRAATPIDITLLSEALLRDGTASRHLRVCLDGENGVLRAWVDGVEAALSPLSGVGAYSADITGALLQVGYGTASYPGAPISHVTLREGVWTDADDLALGWRPRPNWTPGMIAQIEFDGGVPLDTGPSALTLTPTGSPTYVEVDNPDPSAVFLEGMNTGNRPSGGITDKYRPIVPFYMGDTEIEWNQAVMAIHDPYNADGAIKVGRLFIPASFKPSYGREPGADFSIQSPPVGSTREGAPIISSRGSWQDRDVSITALTDAECEELFARLARYSLNKRPVLCLLRSDVGQHRLGLYTIFGIPVGWSSADFAIGMNLRKASIRIRGVES